MAASRQQVMAASQRVIYPQQQVYGGPRSRRQQVMAASYGSKLWRQVMAASQRVIHPQQQVYGGNITGT